MDEKISASAPLKERAKTLAMAASLSGPGVTSQRSVEEGLEER